MLMRFWHSRWEVEHVTVGRNRWETGGKVPQTLARATAPVVTEGREAFEGTVDQTQFFTILS